MLCEASWRRSWPDRRSLPDRRSARVRRLLAAPIRSARKLWDFRRSAPARRSRPERRVIADRRSGDGAGGGVVPISQRLPLRRRAAAAEQAMQNPSQSAIRRTKVPHCDTLVPGRGVGIGCVLHAQP